MHCNLFTSNSLYSFQAQLKSSTFQDGHWAAPKHPQFIKQEVTGLNVSQWLCSDALGTSAQRKSPLATPDTKNRDAVTLKSCTCLCFKWHNSYIYRELHNLPQKRLPPLSAWGVITLQKIKAASQLRAATPKLTLPVRGCCWLYHSTTTVTPYITS